MAVCNFGSRAESPASSLVLGPVSTPPFCFGARQFLGRGGLCGQPGLDHIPSHEDVSPAHSGLQKNATRESNNSGFQIVCAEKSSQAKLRTCLSSGKLDG